jgi:hypothetical protein
MRNRRIQSGNFVHPKRKLPLTVAGSVEVSVEVSAEVPTLKLTIQPQYFAIRRNRIGDLNASAYSDDMP